MTCAQVPLGKEAGEKNKLQGTKEEVEIACAGKLEVERLENGKVDEKCGQHSEAGIEAHNKFNGTTETNKRNVRKKKKRGGEDRVEKSKNLLIIARRWFGGKKRKKKQLRAQA